VEIASASLPGRTRIFLIALHLKPQNLSTLSLARGCVALALHRGCNHPHVPRRHLDEISAHPGVYVLYGMRLSIHTLCSTKGRGCGFYSSCNLSLHPPASAIDPRYGTSDYGQNDTTKDTSHTCTAQELKINGGRTTSDGGKVVCLIHCEEWVDGELYESMLPREKQQRTYQRRPWNVGASARWIGSTGNGRVSDREEWRTGKQETRKIFCVAWGERGMGRGGHIGGRKHTRSTR
jgi:hypothetical protein